MTIQFKRTNTNGKVPQVADLVVGELAVNLADKKIYSKNGAGAVVQLSGPQLPWSASSTGVAVGMNLVSNTNDATGCVLRVEDNGTLAHNTHGALQTMVMSGVADKTKKFITFVNNTHQVGHVDGAGNMWLKGNIGINTSIQDTAKINVNAGATRLGLNLSYSFGEANRAGIRVEDASAFEHDNVSGAIRLFASNKNADRTKQFFIRGLDKQNDNNDKTSFSVRRDGLIEARELKLAENIAANSITLVQSVSAQSVNVKAPTDDHGYVSFYTNKNSGNRTGWVGFGSAGTTVFSLRNERGGGTLDMDGTSLRYDDKVVLTGNAEGVSGRWDALVSKHFTGTPAHGIKITTNIPFTNGIQMPQIKIEGSPYTGRTFEILLGFYIHNGAYYNMSASSSGGYIAPIKLGVENGKVVIFLDDKQYYAQYHVSAVSKWITDLSSHYKDWTITDAALAATHVVSLPYTNKVEHLEVTGNVGIGTLPTGTHKLSITTTTHRSDDSGALRVADDGNANHSDIQGVVKASTTRTDINKNLFLGQANGTKVFAVSNSGGVYIKGSARIGGLELKSGYEGGVVAGVHEGNRRFWIAPNRKASDASPVHSEAYAFTKGTIVRTTTNAYMAKQAVPLNTPITDTAYWEDKGLASNYIIPDFGSELGYDAANKRWYCEADMKVDKRIGIGVNPNILTAGYGSHKLNVNSMSGNGTLLMSNGSANSNLTVLNPSTSNTGGLVRILGGVGSAAITIRKSPTDDGDGTLTGQWSADGNLVTHGNVQIGKLALPTNDKFRVLADTADNLTYSGVFLNQKYGGGKNGVLTVCHYGSNSLLFHGQSYDNEGRSGATDRFKVFADGKIWADSTITSTGSIAATLHLTCGINQGIAGHQIEPGNEEVATHRFDSKALRFWCGHLSRTTDNEMLRIDSANNMTTLTTDLTLNKKRIHDVSEIHFSADATDSVAIKTTVSGGTTNLDFIIGDDVGGNDRFRFQAKPATFGVPDPVRTIQELYWTDNSDLNSGYVKTYGINYAIDFIKTSDINNKRDVVTVDEALNKVCDLRGVDYTWKHNNDRDSGVIAQEVEHVLPHLVHTQEDGTKAVSYSGFTGVFIEAFKELKAENDMLKAELSKMQAPDVSAEVIKKLQDELANIKKVLGI